MVAISRQHVLAKAGYRVPESLGPPPTLQEVLDQSVTQVNFLDAQLQAVQASEAATATTVVREAGRLRAAYIWIAAGPDLRQYLFNAAGEFEAVGLMEGVRPVQEQSGPDLARRLQPALDKLDSASVVVGSVVSIAPSPAKETLDRSESMINEAYGAVQRGQSQLFQAAARPRALGEVSYQQQAGVLKPMVQQLEQMRNQLNGVITSITNATLKRELSDVDIALAAVLQDIENLAYDMERGGWET
jgi:hypothetical protein